MWTVLQCHLGSWGRMAHVHDARQCPGGHPADLRAAGRLDPELTQKIKSLSGTEVEIQGFMIPAGLPDLAFFLLSRVSSIGNYCCEAPVGQDETVYVFATRVDHITYDPLRVYKVRGVFDAGMKKDEVYGLSLFRIRQARVEEAVGPPS